MAQDFSIVSLTAEQQKLLGAPAVAPSGDFEIVDLEAPAERDARPPETPFDWSDLEKKGRRRNQFGNHLADAFIGALKGGGQTAVNLGRIMHLVPGVSDAVDWLYGAPVSDQSFVEADKVLEPTNTAQAIGKGVEQIAEVILPAGAIRAAGTKAVTTLAPKLTGLVGETAAKAIPRVAVEGVTSGGMAAAQGGDVTTGAVLGAAIPAVGAVARAAAPVLKAQAAEKVMQALGPTKEKYKAIAERLTPSLLHRGIKGSRESIKAQAEEMVATTGAAVDDALEQFAHRRLDATAVVDALEQAKNPYRVAVLNPRTGTDELMTIDPRPIGQLTGLQTIIGKLGPSPSVEQLVAVRRAWDTIVSQAGGYAHRAGGGIGMPLKDQSEAWAKRKGANAIRALLAEEVPDLAAVNKEFAFWKGLDDVLTQTLQRTQPQKKGALAEMAGRAAGVAVGAPSGPAGMVGAAYAAGKLVKWLGTVVDSPRWKLYDARMRNRIADALMSGNEREIASIVGREVAVQGSKVPAMAGGK